MRRNQRNPLIYGPDRREWGSSENVVTILLLASFPCFLLLPLYISSPGWNPQLSSTPSMAAGVRCLHRDKSKGCPRGGLSKIWAEINFWRSAQSIRHSCWILSTSLAQPSDPGVHPVSASVSAHSTHPILGMMPETPSYCSFLANNLAAPGCL